MMKAMVIDERWPRGTGPGSFLRRKFGAGLWVCFVPEADKAGITINHSTRSKSVSW